MGTTSFDASNAWFVDRIGFMLVSTLGKMVEDSLSITNGSNMSCICIRRAGRGSGGATNM